MNATIEQQVALLNSDKFVKYTNTDYFTELSEETKGFLKTYGLPCNDFGTYPNFMSDGKLKKFSPDLIEIGLSNTKDKYCIDISNNERVVFYDIDNQEIDIVNSSVQKFLECRYVMAYYYQEIEFKKRYGEYYEYLNYKKYAKILRDMLNDVEPGIENFPTWEEELFQKELGVI